jgi:pimeloyl-ACP methyl ester carboxylesterase
MSPEQLITALSLLLSDSPAATFDRLVAGGHDARYPVEVTACPETSEPLDIEGQTLLCGTVSVPENYAQPDGRRIPLHFVLGAARSRAPFPDAIVYLHGGPAGGALDNIAQTTGTVLGAHRAHRDVVSFDQRGAMLSSTNVRCYGEMADNIVRIARAVEDVVPPPGEAPFDMADFYAPCIAELYASGADLRQYNTENNARDVRAVMSALGYPAYNILGISYGSRLALEVLRSAPQGVRAVIIDGVAPPDVKLYDDLLPPHADAMEALFDQCAADAACAAAYPSLRDDFIALGTGLTATPIAAARGRPEISAQLFYEIVSARTAYSQPWARALTGYLPRIITELARGEATTLDWYLDTYGDAPPPPRPEGLGSLDGETRALALSLIASADSLRAQEGSIATLLAQLKHDIHRTASPLPVADAFDARASRALQAMDRPAAVAAMRDYARFPLLPRDKTTLIAWVTAHFSGPDQRALLELIAAMQPADVARSFAIAERDLAPYQSVIEKDIGLYIYACQEDVPYNTLAGFRAVARDFAYPVIATPQTLAEFEAFYAVCDLFETAPRAGFHAPVRSDVPVLAMGGTNDTDQLEMDAPRR